MFFLADVSPSKDISLKDEVFAVFSRLRLNMSLQDLAKRMDLSDVMFIRLKFLIVWPTLELLQNNIPLVFQQLYPNCQVIIDCNEIFIKTPSSFGAHAKIYSNYKKHNTVKFLIGITPCGTISFLSQCWGG